MGRLVVIPLLVVFRPAMQFWAIHIGAHRRMLISFWCPSGSAPELAAVLLRVLLVSRAAVHAHRL